MTRTLFFASLIVLLAAAAGAAEICEEPVSTVSGLVSGKSDIGTNTCVYKGIPYAAPPVGELRFKAPEPAPEWDRVYVAGEYGAPCMQVPAMKGQSEDCLYLNIWRPRKSGVFPVMLWIHGGGYIMGSGSQGSAAGSYNGANLSDFGDVVVVTINYRLHVFGYLSHPALRAEDKNGSAGNYGSLDQVAAIRWTRENIDGFGGDPDNITIFGESAGGWSVCTMVASPLNAGNFHKAIIESGGCQKSKDAETDYSLGYRVAREVGCERDDIQCLRSVPAKKFMRGALVGLVGDGMVWGPHHDGYLLTERPVDMIRAGNYNKVPFLAGFNRDEVDAVLRLRPRIWHAAPFNYARTMRRVLNLSDLEMNRLLALYPLSDYDDRPRRAFGRLFTEGGLACPTFLGADAMAARGEGVYFYRFDYDDMKRGELLGAIHGAEIAFVFNSLEGDGESAGAYDEHNIGSARELSRTIQGYWTNFARSGNPNGAGLPYWPEFERDTRLMQVLDAEVKTERADMEERCRFWDDYSRNHQGLEETLGTRGDR